MGDVINFLERLKQREQESAEKSVELLKRCQEFEDAAQYEWRDKVARAAQEELDRTVALRKLVLNIENPQQHLAHIKIDTSKIPEPVDFTPIVTQNHK